MACTAADVLLRPSLLEMEKSSLEYHQLPLSSLLKVTVPKPREGRGRKRGKGLGKQSRERILAKQELVLTGSKISRRFLRGTAPSSARDPEPFPATEHGERASSNGTAFSSP